MRLAVIADPLDSFKIYKDSTYALMLAAQQRGHEIFVVLQEDLYSIGAHVRCSARKLAIGDQSPDWAQLDAAFDYALHEFDCVLMRKDPPFDMEYIFTTYMLELAQAQGARVFNNPRAVRDHNEKFAINKFAQFTAPTLATRDAGRIREFLAEHRSIVVKPLDAMGGSGIFKLVEGDANVNAVIESVGRLGSRTVMAQRFIDDIRAGDKRILIIDGQVVPYALARIPAADDFRGNLAAGARGVAQPLSPRDREIAETLAPALKALDLFIVGLDVIGDYLTEVNVTSPTGMREIAAQTDCDPARMTIDALEARLNG